MNTQMLTLMKNKLLLLGATLILGGALYFLVKDPFPSAEELRYASWRAELQDLSTVQIEVQLTPPVLPESHHLLLSGRDHPKELIRLLDLIRETKLFSFPEVKEGPITVTVKNGEQLFKKVVDAKKLENLPQGTLFLTLVTLYEASTTGHSLKQSEPKE